MQKQTNVDWRKQFIFAAIAIFVLLAAATFAVAQSADASFEQGTKLFEKGKYNEAIIAFQKYAALKPDDANAPHNIGEAYYHLKQFDKAVEYYRKAVAIDANLKEAWESMGDVLFSNQEKWSDAADAYEHLVKLDPTAENYYSLGSAYYNDSQFNKAAVAYRQSLALNPKDKDAKKSLADAEAELKNNKGNTQPTNATTDQSRTAQAEILFNQGVEYANAKDYKKAVKFFEQTAKLITDNPGVFYNLGLSYYNIKQYTKSADAFQKVLQLDPNYRDARQNLADAEAAQKAESDKRKALWNGIVNATAEAVKSEDAEEVGSKTNGNVAANGSLPAGKYQCRTLMIGGLIQERDSFHIYADGTYQVDNQNNARSPYSYDANSGAIQWRGDGFSMAAKSWFDAERGLVFIRLGNENWDCGIRGGQ